MKYLDKSYEKDEYVKRWLAGLSERSKINYLREIHEWLSFVDLTPTQQIKKRIIKKGLKKNLRIEVSRD